MRYPILLSSVAVLCIAAFTVPARAADTEGGAMQMRAQAGCLNQWLFNGVWRVRVQRVAYRPKGAAPNGWDVTMQWANGTSIAALEPAATFKEDLVLVLTNGDTVTGTQTAPSSLNEQKLDLHEFPPGAPYTFTQRFLSNDALDESNRPVKLLVTFGVAAYKVQHPGGRGVWNVKTPAYNYRFDLTCDKRAGSSARGSRAPSSRAS